MTIKPCVYCGRNANQRSRLAHAWQELSNTLNPKAIAEGDTEPVCTKCLGDILETGFRVHGQTHAVITIMPGPCPCPIQKKGKSRP